MAASSNTSNEIDTLNFAELGIRWTVRHTTGERSRFTSLSELQEALDVGEVTQQDALTFDGNIWRTLSDIPDLRAFFWQVWKRAQRGEIQSAWMPTIGAGIAEDAPTTLAPPDQELSAALKQVLSEELMARSKAFATPPAPEPPKSPAPAEPPKSPAPAAASAEIPAAAHHAVSAPVSSDIPSLMRGMLTSLILVGIALMLLLTL